MDVDQAVEIEVAAILDWLLSPTYDADREKSDDDPFDSDPATFDLVMIGQKAVPQILERLPKKPGHLVRVLGLIGDPRAVEPLVNMLKDPLHQELDEVIVGVLGEIGDPRALDEMLIRVRLSSPAALEAVLKIDHPKTRIMLENIVNNLDNSDRLRRKVTEGLKRFPLPKERDRRFIRKP